VAAASVARNGSFAIPLVHKIAIVALHDEAAGSTEVRELTGPDSHHYNFPERFWRRFVAGAATVDV
jgi:hypothetical protein